MSRASNASPKSRKIARILGKTAYVLCYILSCENEHIRAKERDSGRVLGGRAGRAGGRGRALPSPANGGAATPARGGDGDGAGPIATAGRSRPRQRHGAGTMPDPPGAGRSGSRPRGETFLSSSFSPTNTKRRRTRRPPLSAAARAPPIDHGGAGPRPAGTMPADPRAWTAPHMDSGSPQGP